MNVRPSLLARSVVALAFLAGLLPLTPAAASAPAAPSCQLEPGRELSVETVPEVPDFAFEIGGRRYRTGPDGTVSIDPVVCRQPDRAVVAVTKSLDRGRGKTATFTGWYGTDLLAPGKDDGVLYATFDQHVRVRLALTDLADHAVSRDLVGAVVLRSSTGADLTVPPDETSAVLDASRVVQRSNRLVSRDITWSVQTADIGGNTAINRGEVRFHPRQTRTVRVRLMLFDLQVAVRDVLLHRSAGDDVRLVSPDGSERTIRLDPDGRGEIRGLARGHYDLRASGTSIAMSFDQPVAVSRPLDVDLTVISHLDVALFGGTAALVVVGLLLTGWRLRVRSSRHRAEQPAPAASAPARPRAGTGPGSRKAAT